MKRAYKRLEAFWTQYLLGPDWSPFVLLSDALKSPCGYCHFWRGVLVGLGLGLVLVGYPFGLLVIAVAGLLALAESIYG